MRDHDHANGSPIISGAPDYDAVIVGASLAGCSTAIFLGRAGARVALVEKSPDPQAFKRMCTHFIQSSAVPTLERLELLEPIVAAGGLRSDFRAWTQWGWIKAPPERTVASVNLRREVLDPLLRETAAATPGVELLLGQNAQELLRAQDGSVSGVVVRDTKGTELRLGARLTIGADGRDSHIAELSGVPVKTTPHGRFAYGGYFEGPGPAGAPDGSIWMMDPQLAAAFPTDGGLTFYAAMGTLDRLPEFKRDPEAALVKWISDVPEPPPIRASRLVGPVLGKIEMENRLRRPVAPGLALVGDAALAIDPLWGVGCGLAFQTAEWLADSVTPALLRGEALDAGLDALPQASRARPRRARADDGRLRDRPAAERGGAAAVLRHHARRARSPRASTRSAPAASARARMLATTLPRAMAVNARHALRRRPAAAPSPATAAPREREREAVNA